MSFDVGTDRRRHVQTVRFVNCDAAMTSVFAAQFKSLHAAAMAGHETVDERRTEDGEIVDASRSSHHLTSVSVDKADEQLENVAADSHQVVVRPSAAGTTTVRSASVTTGSNIFPITSSPALVPTFSDPYRMVTSCGIDVRIYYGNLIDEKVDAVVNPANPQLVHGGGAARAVAQAAGRQLQDECRAYIRQHGQLNIAQPMHTTAGKMSPPVMYVIHVAGPSAAQFPNLDDLYQAVFDTFYHCLLYANNSLHVSSLSIPAISSGE